MGTDVSQYIKLWDARPQQPVYELVTGNNDVDGMAWDAARAIYPAGISAVSKLHHLGPNNGE